MKNERSMEVERFEKLQTKVEELKSELDEKKGRYSAIIQEADKEFGTSNLEELKKIEVKLKDKQQKIKDKYKKELEELEELILEIEESISDDDD